MSDVPISGLPAAGSLTGTEAIPGVQNGQTVQIPSGAFGIPGTNNLGYLGIPRNLQNADYQLVLTDQGKYIYHTAAGANTYTIPASATVAIPRDSVITIALGGVSGNITLTPAGGVTLREAGTTNTGARTLIANALATLLKVDTDEWMISGVGVS